MIVLCFVAQDIPLPCTGGHVMPESGNALLKLKKGGINSEQCASFRFSEDEDSIEVYRGWRPFTKAANIEVDDLLVIKVKVLTFQFVLTVEVVTDGHGDPDDRDNDQDPEEDNDDYEEENNDENKEEEADEDTMSVVDDNF